jgi:hypothetical protein
MPCRNPDEQGVDPGLQIDAAQAVEAPVEPQQLTRAERVVKPEVLGKEPDPGARGSIAEWFAEHAPAPAARLGQRQQHLDRGRLPRAVQTEKAEDPSHQPSRQRLLR